MFTIIAVIQPEFAAIEVDGYVLLDGQVNNSFYLPMENQDDFEKDKSGNGNDWTKNNFSGTETDPDVLKDSPSGAAFSGAPTSGVTTTSSAPSIIALEIHLITLMLNYQKEKSVLIMVVVTMILFLGLKHRLMENNILKLL